MDIGPHLTVDRTTAEGGTTRLAVAGEIDMATGDGFRRDLLGALDEPGLRRLSLDVGALQFIDSHGVSVLVEARRTADDRGVTFAVTNADPVVRSVLELLGVYDMLASEN